MMCISSVIIISNNVIYLHASKMAISVFVPIQSRIFEYDCDANNNGVRSRRRTVLGLTRYTESNPNVPSQLCLRCTVELQSHKLAEQLRATHVSELVKTNIRLVTFRSRPS